MIQTPLIESCTTGRHGTKPSTRGRFLVFRQVRTIEPCTGIALTAAGLDWTRPPRTWSELLRCSKVLTIPGKRAGFIPNFGNSWLYLYAFQNDAYFLSQDGTRCTLNTPEAVAALSFMKQGYEILGGYAASASLESGFQGKENDPFLTGQVVMKIDGDWCLPGIARYGPGLDFGVAPPPIPYDRLSHTGRFATDVDTYLTWCGGFSLAMPRGCPHPDLAWDFIKFATSMKGRLIENAAQASADHAKGRLYLPRIAGLIAANDELLKLYKPRDPKFADGLKTHMDLMNSARTRPPTIVGQLLWDEHVRATEQTMTGKMSATEALSAGQKTVQRGLDMLTQKHRLSVVSLWTVGLVGIVLLLGSIGFFYRECRRAKLGKLSRKEAWSGILCVAPWLIGFLVFTAEPMLASLFFSFTDYDVLSDPRWVGLRNFSELFGDDRSNIVKAFGNAAYMAGVGVPLGLVTGLAVALLLNSAVRGMRVYRTAFYIPAIVPVVASSVLWIWLLAPDPNKGLINAIWMRTVGPWLHAPMPGWLSAEAWAKPALILMGVWGAGSGMILWLAGLKNIPRSLYEAAEIDGANRQRLFYRVTLPMLSPVLFFNIVMGLIGAIQEFDRVYVMSGDEGNGPSDALLMPSKYLFTNAFGYFKMGYASALAWTLFAVIMLITLVQFWIARYWVFEEGGA